jgi:hypothetical protein
MKRAALFVLLLLTTSFACLPLAAEEPKPITDISEAKSACLVNQGTDLGTVDDVREKLKEWGRWKLVSHPEEADLLVVVSEQQIVAGSISTANGYASGYGHYATGSSTAIGAPLIIPKVFLSVVDRQSGNIYTSVSATRRRHIGGSPAYLVSKLRDQIEKHERRREK